MINDTPSAVLLSHFELTDSVASFWWLRQLTAVNSEIPEKSLKNSRDPNDDRTSSNALNFLYLIENTSL